MEELIGKKFKRNKYGLSNWEDIIRFVTIRRDFSNKLYKSPKMTLVTYKERLQNQRKYGYKAIIQVRGTSNIWYDLSEIIIYD